MWKNGIIFMNTIKEEPVKRKISNTQYFGEIFSITSSNIKLEWCWQYSITLNFSYHFIYLAILLLGACPEEIVFDVCQRYLLSKIEHLNV